MNCGVKWQHIIIIGNVIIYIPEFPSRLLYGYCVLSLPQLHFLNKSLQVHISKEILAIRSISVAQKDAQKIQRIKFQEFQPLHFLKSICFKPISSSSMQFQCQSLNGFVPCDEKSRKN